MMKGIEVKKLDKKAVIPAVKKGDCFDLYSVSIDLHTQMAVELDKKVKFGSSNAHKYTGKGTLVSYRPGDTLVVHTGLAMKLPEGHFARCYARSSVYAKYGLLLANSVGIIDNSYQGDSDEWIFVFYATRKGVVEVGERLTQFEVAESHVKEFAFQEVDTLGSANRGGFGSTGTK